MADRAQDAPAAALLNLLTLMAQLRDPDTGCPWDVQQDFASIAPYTIEEAYEVADAIARGDIADLRDELGDLLLQVVFHARIAEEAGHFDFTAVAAALRVVSERSGRFGLLPVSAGIIGALCETLAKVMTKSVGTSYVDTAAILAVIFVFIMCELYIIRASLRVLPMTTRPRS